ncbi:MAG: c-type cytochrome [Sulfurimonas sp.]|jgi:cytochrome c553
MKIAISIVAALFLIGCGEGDKKAAEATATQAETPVAAVKSEPAPVKAEVKNDTADKVKTAVNDVADKSKEVTNKAADSAKEVVTSMADTMTSMMPTTATTASGESIFKVCASCHGLSGEKAALGKSQIIKGWSASKVADALKGYKADSYGGAMKGVMKGQVSKLSNDEIKAVSEYISKL